MFEAASDCAMLTTDAEGVVTAWSVGAEELFGWAAEDMLG
ncbi:PAS domain S-box protein [Stutzerimonas xanthomarina]